MLTAGPAGLDAGDRQVFTLQITPATGAYTFTLLDQLDHGLGANDNDEALLPSTCRRSLLRPTRTATSSR